MLIVYWLATNLWLQSSWLFIVIRWILRHMIIICSDHEAKGIKPQLEKSNLEWKRVLSRYRDHGQHQPEALLSRHRHPAVRGRSGCRVSWTSQMAQFSYRRCSWSFRVKGRIRSLKFQWKCFVIYMYIRFFGNSVTCPSTVVTKSLIRFCLFFHSDVRWWQICCSVHHRRLWTC